MLDGMLFVGFHKSGLIRHLTNAPKHCTLVLTIILSCSQSGCFAVNQLQTFIVFGLFVSLAITAVQGFFSPGNECNAVPGGMS